MMTAKSHHRCLVFFYLRVQNLHHINQRKKHLYTQRRVTIRTIRTIRTMNTMAGFSVIGMLKNCVALNKEKDVGLIQASSADEDDKDDEYDSGFFYLSFPSRDAQNLRRIKQRKGLYLIHE